jgi:glycerol kinase
MVPGSASSSWAAGEAKKSTYGTGGFILLNTREEVTQPSHGLLSTIAYKIGPYVTTNYALESSIAIAGPVVKWLRDSLEIISAAVEIEILAGSVQDSGGIYFVPHSGLCNHGSHCSRGAQEYVLVLLGE